MPDVLYVAISLAGVLGLMFLTFFGLRMFTRRITTTGGRLRVIDRASLGRESMLLVVSVCGKLMLVGVSSQRVEKISDLEQTEEEYIAAISTGSAALPFSDILSTVATAANNFSDRYRKNKKEANEPDEKVEKIENE